MVDRPAKRRERFAVYITNESVRNFLVLALAALLSGTFVGSVPLYILAQHEPKELFYMRELMTADYAPLWITLVAIQFGPYIVSRLISRFRQFRRYGLAILWGPFLTFAVPPLDPTAYSSYYTRCARISDQEILDVARAGLLDSLDFLTTNYGEMPQDLASAEMVQFVEWYPRSELGYSVSYDTGRQVYYMVNVSPGCGVRLSLSKTLGSPIVGRLIYEKR
jgi:hypothetical protein